MTESIPFWEDWRVWSVAAAFFGFTFGTLIKFGFDLWLDRIRRNRQKVVFAIAFRAELHTLIGEASVRQRVLGRTKMSTIDATDLSLFDVPAMAVYDNNTHRLGEFGGRIAGLVVRAHGTADHIRHFVATSQTPEMTVSSAILEAFQTKFLRLIRNAEIAHNALDVFLGDAERYPNLTDVPAKVDPAGALAEPAEPDAAPAP